MFPWLFVFKQKIINHKTKDFRLPICDPALIIHKENLFDHLMEATKVCSLGQITSALFEVGGQYRRNM
ncbi:hypothetical protein B0A64_12110 [Flavobacterium araucananum]|uniref:Uncharacterized protein n=1 Tax=Flavobacterium araucananum TaxID=946678 RepID=A0A227P9E0_9FLAO|nr:hypothetical protein B0A64_12110 [Flavobacterium araucananum]